ncbi:SpoIIE family protein phosphatase [Geodermatophilus sabuli]|uniref:histidine kinase n=1 Tax=Geodermatophilus sabuli TaxID=1564158 RepID=A0A285EE57_9ACTN|nr:SpoIIE family protein phosphatase [Geodermatophilus sabuli]MBB3086377.1 anti-anti-sigma factor [Geodermatophilus sabuli]SNX97408.1 anti-anti-sigma factor [Geodermatophilus sabuli]
MTEHAPGRSIFSGGGEVGRAMADRDWTQTPLGPPRGWPSELRNVVRIMLTSRFPMWAAWGSELTFFYNDAYRRDTLRAKHPWALGRPASEVWAEIWHDIGPRVRSVLDTGVATWDEDLLLFLERSDYQEETYHTFSYSPLGDDDGRAPGMLCVVTENTERVVGERRVAVLRDLAAAVATTRTRADVLTAVDEQLGRDLADLPFSLTYLFDATGTARLSVASGIEPGSAAAPAVLTPADDVWPLDRVLAGEQVLVDRLDDRFPDLPTGAWQLPPTEAVVVPIASSAQEGEPVSGFLVAGLNPHRRYDDRYRGFIELIGNQIASGLLNAGSYEAERSRAEALAELDRAKTDFFSNVSHEFRTPLTLIAGPVAELRGNPTVQADPRVREELEVIERNALRLGKLVNTLLDFSRIQAGRIDARFEPVDLAATTAELASVFRSAVTRAGLEFTVDCPPLDEPVHVDRDMWEKVVLNLLSNALKFTFSGGISVRLRRDGGAAQLTVSDTGTGIPPGELPRLFERFHRVADARGRSGEGSGIGLAMVRELVGLHGGSVDVDSTVGVGTTFTVTVPFGAAHLPTERLAEPSVESSAEAAEPTAEVPAVSPAAAPFVTEALRWLPDRDGAPVEGAGSPGTQAGRVLVADDNADMRAYLVRLLAPRYAVRAVADGRQALEAALADPPDLVVSDVMMPELDGMELLAALRADARTARTPVVLLSARAGEEAAVEGMAAGADDYLVKPFSAQELVARVDAHLHLGRVRRAAEERFTAMADLAPALIWVADPDGRRVFVNRGWTQFTGRPAGEELGEGWADLLHPEDRDRYAAVVAAARGRREGWEVEFRLRRDDGAYHWLLERAVPIGAGDTPAGHVGSCTDVNARIRETERQTLLAEVGALLDHESTIDGQLAALARLLVSRRLAELCTVRLVRDDGTLRWAGIAGVDGPTEAALAELDPDVGVGPEVVRTGRVVVHATLAEASALGTDHPALAAPLAVASVLALPLTVRGRVLAVLVLGRRGDAPPYTQDDRALAEEIAVRAALAVDNALLLADERAAAHRLALLQRATAELSAATTPVEVATAAAGHLRSLTGPESRVAVYEIDASHRALSALAISGGSDAGRRLWSSLPLSAPLVATTAVTQRRPIWVEDVSADPVAGRPLPAEFAEALRAYGLAANVAVPLVVAGRVVGVLAVGWPTVQRFSEVDRAMLLAVAEQCAQALDRARLFRAEQGIAETLQLSLLPAQLPRLDRLALAAHYLPGAEGAQAGGDWYDVVELPDGRVAIAVGDVVGQGPSAAAVMGQLRSALSAALLQGCEPAEALELLDRFAARLPGALGSTAACLVVDGVAGTVRWARAGHPPPLVVGPGGSRFLDGAGSGAVLGAPDRPPYREGVTEVAPGTTLLLYTDGLVERRGEVLDEGLARVCDAATLHVAADPARLTARLLADVLADTDQPDDVAVIAARVLPGPLAVRLPADPARLSAARRAVAAWLATVGVPEETAEDLHLALGEALANAVEHAYAAAPGAGECSYRLDRDLDGGIRVEVRDTGVWRPPPADRGFRGRGLDLIHALGSDVEIGRGADGVGTTVRFRVAADGVAGGRGTVPPRTRPAVHSGIPARLRVSDGPDEVRLEVVGELDIATAGPVRDELLRYLDRLPPGSVAVLDLRPTSYLASAGVGLVLEALARAGDVGVALHLRTERGSPPARILALAGVVADDATVPSA